MEPLKRKIGYIKPEVQTEEPVETHPTTDISSREKSKKITAWIKSHPYFKWGSMCIHIGVDKGNFQRTLKSKSPNIKPAIIAKIEESLTQYGYNG